MSAKGGKNKRAKKVRHLDSNDAPSLSQSIIDKRLNIIPAGRQLERTPPPRSEIIRICQSNTPDDTPASEHAVKDEPCAQEITKRVSCNESSEVLEHSQVKDERVSIWRSSCTVASATPGKTNPETFIQGMQGYQWTETDLEFVYQTKWKKQVQQLQQEISDVQKFLKSTKQMRDMALAAHEKLQTELSKVSSCERIHQMSREILLKSQSSSQLEGLDSKALLARLKVTDTQCATTEEKTEVSKLKTKVAKAQEMREKEEQLTKDIDSCKMNIDQVKVNIHTLTADMSTLESQVLHKEGAPQSAKPQQRIRGRKPPAAVSAPKPSKPTNVPKTPEAPTVPTPSKPTTNPKPLTAPKPSKPTTKPKPTKAPAAPKPSKLTTTPEPPIAPKPSKPTTTSKPSTAPKPSKPTTTPEPPIAPKPSKPTTTSKPSTAPKPSKPTTTPKPPKAPTASRPSKPTTIPNAPTAPKPSKAHIAPKSSKPTTAPKPVEGDGDLRRSKRIAAKKDK
ncbi:proteoglycan 4 [Myxocyprinus asiaticus]|uniref:proteoglycan 4 n=1 Tax=Myxocyprinus asiaticus TaxID=70543 RepID=UPI002221C8AE|nr:proteoglycan 4 [Myxocyprinus asiaticus]